MDCMVTTATMYGHMHIYIYIQIHACTFHYTPRNITIYNLYILYIIYIYYIYNIYNIYIYDYMYIYKCVRESPCVACILVQGIFSLTWPHRRPHRRIGRSGFGTAKLYPRTGEEDLPPSLFNSLPLIMLWFRCGCIFDLWNADGYTMTG